MPIISMEEIKDGFDFIGITDTETIQSIYDARRDNEIWQVEQIEIKRNQKAFRDRHKIPRGKTKKEYIQLLKETQQIIDDYKERYRDPRNNEITRAFIEDGRDEWIEKKEKLKKLIKHNINFSNTNDRLLRAKEYPVEQLIEFNRSGFTKCIFHEEKTGSMKWYPKSNNTYCFSCHKKSDAIDIYCKLYNVSINEAITKLQ